MVISALRQTSPGRLTVCFEDGEELKSTLGVVTDMRLYSGRELDDETLEELRLASHRSIMRERALDYVSRRPMSRKELTDKLIRKGEDEDTAEYCARWLEENGFISDESYSAAISRHYAAKGYGEGRIRAELSRRGINRELWEDALSAVPEDTSKLDKLVTQRLKDPEDREQVGKLCQFLYRRGYSWDDIRAALGRYSESCEEEI